MQTVRLLFSTTRQPFSALIRAATWSRWSHVSIIDDDAMVIEASALHGVRRIPLHQALSAASDCNVVSVACADSDSILAAVESQIGRPYDWSGIASLELHRDWQDDSKWFCSELIAWAFELTGQPLFRAECMRRVTPQHLWMLAPMPPKRLKTTTKRAANRGPSF
jgi:hypothetical protein